MPEVGDYLVNHMLSPGFLLGDVNSESIFCFLEDVVPPGETAPRVYARLFDSRGVFLLELDRNNIGENPCHCSYKATPAGFRIVYPSGELM